MIELLWFIVGLTGLLMFFYALGGVLYLPVSTRVFGEAPWLPIAWHEPIGDGENVEVFTSDGSLISGTYLPTTAPSRRGVIAYCHELNGNRWNAVPYIHDLRRCGFDVFTFDFRNHGHSDSVAGYDPLPWTTTYEVADVHAVIDYLCGRSDADPRGVGLLGVSKGATAAMCAAAGDRRVRAMVLDSLCPTERMQIHFTRRFMGIYARFAGLLSSLPDVVLGSLGVWTKYLIQWRQNCQFVNVDQLARQVRQPVLIIHGERDTYVPLDVVRSLRSMIIGRTKLWVVPRAKHNGAVVVTRKRYHDRISRFFKQHLAGAMRKEEIAA